MNDAAVTTDSFTDSGVATMSRGHMVVVQVGTCIQGGACCMIAGGPMKLAKRQKSGAFECKSHSSENSIGDPMSLQLSANRLTSRSHIPFPFHLDSCLLVGSGPMMSFQEPRAIWMHA
jgi:hypothetical protein